MEKIVSSFFTRPPAEPQPALAVELPAAAPARLVGPRARVALPGLVSTLLNQTYSVPGRLVHTCLQVTEQVWQPMHLSRFITIATWARTRISTSTSWLRLRTTVTESRLEPGRAVVVRAPRQLGVAADHVRRLHRDRGQRVLGAAAAAVDLASAAC